MMALNTPLKPSPTNITPHPTPQLLHHISFILPYYSKGAIPSIISGNCTREIPGRSIKEVNIVPVRALSSSCVGWEGVCMPLRWKDQAEAER